MSEKTTASAADARGEAGTAGAGYAATAPGTADTRLYALDAVRGFAVVAMVIAHTSPFILPASRLVGYAEGTLNDLAAPLFALVIGATMAFTGPASDAPAAERRRHRLQTAGRALMLVLLGVLLGLRFSGVQIVLEYLGIALLCALPFLHLRTRTLLGWAVPLLLVVPGIITVARAAAEAHPALVYPTTPLTLVLDWLVLGNGYQALTFLPLYLIGIVLGRGVLRNARRALLLLLASVVLFLPAELWKILELPGTGIRGGYVEALREAPLALGAFAFFVWITTAGAAQLSARVQRVLAPVTVQGRMALSIYVLHVVILMGVYTVRAEASGGLLAWFSPPQGWAIQLGLVLLCWAFAAAWWRWMGAGPVERLLGIVTGRHPLRSLWAVSGRR